MTELRLGALLAVGVRLVTPTIGAWFAVVDLDLGDENATAPTGRAVLTIGTETLTGTIDPRASSKVGARASVRLVAGGGAWDSSVPSLHMHNDAGVTLAAVASVTAAEIGEVVGSAPKDPLGRDYFRSTGPASRILHGRDWYVDDLGVTRIEARRELPAPVGLEVLGWDPASACATIAPDAIVRPGWVLTDERFGSQVIRDVEQTWTPDGTRATAYCGSAARSRLGSVLAHAIRELAGVAHLRGYAYRVVAMAGNRVALAPVDGSRGMPAASPVPISFGVPGVTAQLTPGQEVVVEFTDGAAPQPSVRAFVSGTPTTLELAAVAAISIGPTESLQPAARAPAILAVFSALAGYIAALDPIIAASTASPTDKTAATGAGAAVKTAITAAAIPVTGTASAKVLVG